MLIYTGIRLSELANLKVDDVDDEQNLFRVMGKGQRERFVPFGRTVAKAQDEISDEVPTGACWH